MGKRCRRKVRTAPINNNLRAACFRAAPCFPILGSVSSRKCGRLFVMGKQNMAGLAPRRCFGSRMFGAKRRFICDCTRPIPVIIFPQFCSARFRGAANQNQVFHFIKAGLYKCSWASSVPCHSTDAATLTISRSLQMKFPQAKIRFASVLLFVLLAMSFMAAQDLRPGSDGDVRPTGHVQGAAAEKLP